MMKQFAAVILALAMLALPVFGEGDVMVEGNFIKLTTAADFASGTCSNLEPAQIGDGALRLAEGIAEGIYLSEVYQTQPWNDLVASWNADTPRGTKVEVLGRAYLPDYDGWTDSNGVTHDGWTDWITWGEWSPYIERGCPKAADTHPTKRGSEKGWAYAYSYPGYGDSSLNVNDGLTATAFQLKAVVSADGTQKAQPVLRLLSASFKNTNDADWQSKCSLAEPPVTQKESVLLDTPAISQMKRSPEYANVICSATCIAMLINGRGADVLPEDVTLLNYDYGFGGNGNWSFSTAAAGAYGFESYVHYADFAGLRQELSRGYGVSLSVKYSKTEGGKYPYLINAPMNTGGHLITIVGYYCNTELGEYVYYANDPASDDDLAVGHREYRESQLDKAWYRRAAYFVHDRDEGAGASAREYHVGTLWPVQGKPDVYALVTNDGTVLTVPQNFTEKPRAAFGGHGTLAMFVPGEETPLADGVRRVTANHVFYYDRITVSEDGYLQFREGMVPELLAAGTPPTVYVIFNDGSMYTAASVEQKEYVPGTDFSEDTTSVAETTPREVDAALQTVSSKAKLLAIAGAGAIIAAASAVAVLVVRGKRKRR